MEDPAVVAARHAAELAEVRAAEAAVQAEIRTDLAATEATVDALREQVQAHQQQYRELVERHRAEAEAQAERERAESRVLQALAPVRESLSDMQKKVVELESQRNQQHGELAQQLKSATESEERLRSTAESLASALRSNSTRGVWGETQLRSVVEAARPPRARRLRRAVEHPLRFRRGPARPWHGHLGRTVTRLEAAPTYFFRVTRLVSAATFA